MEWQGVTTLMENYDLVTDHPQKDNSEVFHRPVMVPEVIKFLAPKNGIFIDATLGGGGHAEAILKVLEDGCLIGIDLDPEAIAYSQLRLSRFSNFRLFNCNYLELEPIVEAVRKNPLYQDMEIMGILFDLGVSWHQIRTPERGFSYELNGPLDMRFGERIKNKASNIIRYASLPEVEKILREFGEERFYKRIARAIYEKRKQLNTTQELISLIESQLKTMPGKVKRKALQRAFQAFRIATNDELNNLRKGLLIALKLLTIGGRIIVLSYHSLEDRLVKNTFRDWAKQDKLKVLTKKPVRPTEEEINRNPAAFSARLRAAVKTS
jgi:16S rRNA (cytosine1402-N4)-methyltransferase